MNSKGIKRIKQKGELLQMKQNFSVFLYSEWEEYVCICVFYNSEVKSYSYKLSISFFHVAAIYYWIFITVQEIVNSHLKIYFCWQFCLYIHWYIWVLVLHCICVWKRLNYCCHIISKSINIYHPFIEPDNNDVREKNQLN